MRSPSSLQRRARPGLGTLVDITLAEPDPTRAAAAFDAAFDAVALIERLMSAHDPASELNRLCRQAHREPMQVHAETADVLRLAGVVHRESNGVFDVAVGGRLAASGRLPALPDHDAPDLSGTAADIIRHADGRIGFARPMRLDLGGLAKGHAVDCAIRALQGLGVEAALVNAGGDMRAIGTLAHPVDLRFAGGVRTVATLRDGALASSCHADLEAGGAGRHTRPHIDPRSGAAVRSRHTVVVQAASAAVADALTKVALISPAHADRACRGMRAQWRGFDYFSR